MRESTPGGSSLLSTCEVLIDDFTAPWSDICDPNKPMRLADAAAASGFTLPALRTEARKGRLVVSRVANKDFTTLADIERMAAHAAPQ